MISIYCDGSSTGRSDKPGGWAYVIVDGETVIECGYGGDHKTTNNKMEMTAAIKGLERYLTLYGGGKIDAELVSDSQYTLNIADGTFQPQANMELAVRLRHLLGDLIKTRWVKGHSSNIWNQRCDSLAKRGKEENT